VSITVKNIVKINITYVKCRWFTINNDESKTESADLRNGTLAQNLAG
jgi:hypothetical protein